MKKLILILCLGMIAGSVETKDIPTIFYKDSILATDTVGSGTQTFDTTFSGWVKVGGATQINTYVRLLPYGGTVIDTNFTNDTFFVNVQFSFDKVNIVATAQLDSLYDAESVQTGAGDLTANDIVGFYMRSMLIHNTQKRKVANFEKVYGKKLEFYYTLQK